MTLSFNSVILSTIMAKYKSVSFSHGPNKAFLVSDACRTTERNGNILSEDFPKDTIENYLHMLPNKPEKLVKDSFF